MTLKTSESKEDRLQWRKFLQGDEHAFEYIYRRFAPSLFSYGMCFTSNPELVKDGIQELFLKMYGHRLRLKEPHSVTFYLLRAMKNTLLNKLRSKGHLNIDDQTFSFCTEYTTEDLFVGAEDIRKNKEKVELALEVLTPNQKEAIYYHYMEEISIDEIALIMGINYHSVQNLLQRAIKKMRTAFSQCWDGIQENETIKEFENILTTESSENPE